MDKVHTLTLCWFLLISGIASAQEELKSAAAIAFGENFERNVMIAAKTFRVTRQSACDLCADPTVIKELALTPSQLKQMGAIDFSPDVQGIINEMGFGDGRKLGSLEPSEVKEAGQAAVKGIQISQEAIQEKVKSIFTAKQYQRLQEIHLQRTLLFNSRYQLSEHLSLTDKQSQSLRQALVKADEELAIEMQLLKWRKYTAALKQTAGAETLRKFGRPFYVDDKTYSVPADTSKQQRRN